MQKLAHSTVAKASRNQAPVRAVKETDPNALMDSAPMFISIIRSRFPRISRYLCRVAHAHYLTTSVREYVFYGFFRFQKNVTFYVFLK